MQTTINGKPYEFNDLAPEETAVELLRQRAQLTGTKLVCGAGVCGACTILLNHKPACSCLLPAHHLAGKQVETVENYPADNLHPVQRAFMAHDGLQCGYCTPGFIVESIAFYNSWRAEHGREKPNRDQIAAALAGHLCRCGAYQGIYSAVQRACAGEYDQVTELKTQRVDALDKVTGQAQYTTDITRPGQLVGLVVRSTIAHGRITAINLQPAQQMAGVKAIISLMNPGDTVRYVGQEIAAVAAVDQATAQAAVQAITINYENLPVVVGIEQGLASTAPDIWGADKKQAPSAAEGITLPGRWQHNIRTSRVNLGGLNPKRAHQAWSAAGNDPQRTFEGEFNNPGQIHTALEPHGAVAVWLSEEKIEVHVSTQSLAHLKHSLAKEFNLRPENVTVLCEHVGGGFGAKNGASVEAVIALKLAKIAQAPVAVILSRAEEMLVGGYRPGTQTSLKVATQPNGELQAMVAQVTHDNGVGVSGFGTPFMGLAYSGGARDLVDRDVINNSACGKPFRGPSGPGAYWAIEQAADQLAHQRGVDPLALRRLWTKNELRLKMYEWVEQLSVWQNRPAVGSQNGRFKRGVGVSFGQWANIYDPKTEIRLESSPAGLAVFTATQDIGNGVRTTLARTVAEVFGLQPEQIEVNIGNAHYPHGPAAGGSRVTNSVFEPTREAAGLLRDRLFGLAAEELNLSGAKIAPGGLSHAAGFVPWAEALAKIPPQKVTTKRGADDQWMQRMAVFAINNIMTNMDMMMGQGTSQSAVVVEVELDCLLGKITTKRVWEHIAAGKIHVPELAKSQVYGGIIQGLGYALYEEKILDPHTGHNLTFGLEEYRLPGIGDIPEMEVSFYEPGFEQVKGQGIGIAELCTVPVGAAVANAVFNASGWRPLHSPITPARLLQGLGGVA